MISRPMKGTSVPTPKSLGHSVEPMQRLVELEPGAFTGLRHGPIIRYAPFGFYPRVLHPNNLVRGTPVANG